MKIDWKSFRQHYTKPETGKFPVGSRIYKGHQGKGKTLTMVHDALAILEQWPDCVIFSNVKIKGLEPLVWAYDDKLDGIHYYRVSGNYRYIESDNDLKVALSIENGDKGALVLLDEAHLYWQKKDGIPLEVLTCISQQRKDRRKLLMSSQIWEELPVSLRKQVKEIVRCNNFFGRFQVNVVFDGETIQYSKQESTWVCKKISTAIFKHNDLLYNSYDTFQKIVTNSDLIPIPYSPPSIPQDFTLTLKQKQRATIL